MGIVRIFQREQFWMKPLKTLTPHGLNKRKELPPLKLHGKEQYPASADST